MLYLAGIIITFFLSIILAGKKGKSGADTNLALWLAVIGFHLTLFYLYVSSKYTELPWLLGIELALPLTHAPFLFLYTAALTQNRKIKPANLFHFLPLIIVYLSLLPFFLLPPQKKIIV